MRTIEKFMCFKLKTGAYIVAVFCMIFALFLLYLALSTLKTNIYEDIRPKEVSKLVKYEQKLYAKTIEILACLLDFSSAIGMIFINGIYIFGLNTRDAKLMIPGVVTCAFTIIIYPIKVTFIDESIFGLLIAVIVGIIFYFCFLTLYSAYVKVRDEQSTTNTDQ